MAFNRWRNGLTLGFLLAAVATAATMWLAATRKLNLYINPRYDVFAFIMALFSFLAIAATSFHSGHVRVNLGVVKISSIVFGVISLCLACSLLLLQPTALTSSMATQRGINSSGLNLTTTTLATSGFGVTAYSQFDIREWASIIGQTSSISFYAGKTAHLLGFVSPTSNNDPNVFFVSRFYITCCAMDAQPYGVPVYVPNWSKKYPKNSWITVSGGFRANPDKSSAEPIVLAPTQINVVPQPQDPYDH